MSICLSSSPGPPMQGSTSNYSGGAAVSAVPSMAKNDPTSTSSNVCKVNLSCFVYFICTYVICILLGTTDHRERTFSVWVVKHLGFMCTDGSDVIEAVPMEGYRGKSVL
jgi:hypothetical protein